MTSTSGQVAGEAPGGAEAMATASRLVGRNTLILVISQFITTPVSFVVNAALARKLGATDFGAIYLASTVLTVCFLFVEWGGQAQVAAEVARNRSLTSAIFGTGLLHRLVAGGAVLLLLGPFASLMGYDELVRTALWLCGIRAAIVSIGNLCSSVLRGYERFVWFSAANVAANILEATLVVGVLLNGGGLREALTAQAVASLLAVLILLALMNRLGVGWPRFERGALKLLLHGGAGFLALDAVLKLQPYLDAAFLARLAPADELGWYAAASRIVGVLIFPATTMTSALYPTLARLWKEDPQTYHHLTRLALRLVAVLGICAATGTMLFADVVVGLVYGSAHFAPAAATLRVLAGYVVLVYSSIVLGTAIGAAGRQLPWALAQSTCLVFSVVLDPLLIPRFQARFGNGSLGVSVSVLLAEIAMVSAGVALVPGKGLTRSTLRTLLRSLVAAAAMFLAGRALAAFPPVAIGAALVAYFGVLRLLGELDSEIIELVRDVVAVRRRRLRQQGVPAMPSSAG